MRSAPQFHAWTTSVAVNVPGQLTTPLFLQTSITSLWRDGLTTNWAPASIPLSAVSLSRTVPIPTRAPEPYLFLASEISSVALGVVVVTSKTFP